MNESVLSKDASYGNFTKIIFLKDIFVKIF